MWVMLAGQVTTGKASTGLLIHEPNPPSGLTLEKSALLRATTAGLLVKHLIAILLAKSLIAGAFINILSAY